MSTQKLIIKTKIRIQKSVHEVFEAIVDPAKMSNYFIAKGSDRMETGRNLIWNFPEFDMDVPVRVAETNADKYVSFYWDVNSKPHLVEIDLTGDDKATLVTVTEKEEENNEAGRQWLAGNTEGWANFSACLKAYLEYGINLRKGAFDFIKEEFDKN